MPASFAKPSPALSQRFAELAERVPHASVRQMFGCPCCFVNGQMFMGLFGDAMFLRLGDDDRAELLAQGGQPFEPMAGRAMKEYVVVPPDMVGRDASIDPWVDRSLAYALSLPPKPPKASKARATEKRLG